MNFCKMRSEPAFCLRRGLSVVLGVLLAVLMSHTAFAQTFSASIAGTVTDSSGAVVRAAKLQLQNTDTKDIRAQTSADDGSYAFTNLLPGTYKLTVSAQGFKDYAQTDMVLRASIAATVNVSLQVGGTSEQVTVNAGGAELLNTASANNSVTLDSQMLQSLPNNTLQPLNFVYALAGTTESQGMTSRSATLDQYGSTFGLNGGRSAESEILIDGAPSTAVDWGGLMVSPMQDSVQEEQIISNVYDAQYERGGEGIVTLITKSGTEAFHGEVYDFMRNDGLDANYWSNNFYKNPRGKFHRNQFGGNFGGPIWRSKNLFFFGAYEGLRQPGSNGVSVNSVPTDAERAGDFSNTLDKNGNPVPIYNPFSTHQVTVTNADGSTSTYFTRDPFPGNKIPSGLINATGQKIANLYPHPTQAGQGGNDVQNFIKKVGDVTTNDKFDVRVDWDHGPKQRFFARVSDRVRQNDNPTCVFCNGADSGFANQDDGAQGVVNETWTPSQTWVIDVYGAYSRWLEGQSLIGLGSADPSAIGLPKDLFQVKALPIVYAGDYSQMGNPNSTYDRYIRYLSTGLINVTKELTHHTLKFGYNYDVSMINNRKDAPGTFSFSGGFSSCDPQPGGNPCKATQSGSGISGNPIADMLLGTGNGGTDINMDPAFSEHSFGMYVQDDWRMTPKLTISAGFRYENQRPATERYNRTAYFDPKAVNPLSTAFGSTLYGAFEYAGVGGRNRDAWEADNKDFGPRLGFAYRFSDKLVARIGAGLFYGPSSAMLSFDGGGQSPGYTSHTNWLGSSDGYTPTNLVSNPFPNGINQPTGNSLGAMTYVGNGTSQLWPKLPHPVGTIYQWSMDFQYQLSSHAVAEIGYTGVRGRKLLFGNPNFDLDQLPTKDLALGSALDEEVANPLAGVITDPNSFLSNAQIPRNLTMRPFPEYTYLIQTRSLPGARSQFDAFNAKYNYTFHNGLSSLTTYQWSKNLDDGSEAFLGWGIGGSWRDANNPKLDYSLSTHDIPQSFAEAFLYQLPYGTGRRFGGAAPQIVRQTIGGWNLSGAIRLTSGYPLWIPVQWGYPYNNLNNYGFPGNALPDLVGNAKPAHRSVTNWINPGAFQGLSSSGDGSTVNCGQDPGCLPFPYRYGNEPQHYNDLREAPNKNVDLGVGKEFGTEKIKAELRGDFLNVFNHPIYGGTWTITNHFGWGPIGQVQGTRNDPRNIQVALKVMF
jgi:hypothetical protein